MRKNVVTRRNRFYKTGVNFEYKSFSFNKIKIYEQLYEFKPALSNILLSEEL